MPEITRRHTLCAAAAASLAVTPLARSAAQPAPPAPASVPPVRTTAPLFGAKLWTLPNGLTVALVENRRAPVVAQYLYYAAGGGEDPAGRSGVAHFLEHMMFKGSPNVASGLLSRRVAREGGNDNAFTSRDVTAYYQQVEASRLPMIMAMEADRLEAALIPADELESERRVVLEERNQRTDSNPRARFQEAFRAALWGPQTWAGRPIIGWADEIRATTREDLAGFHSHFYAPANATLVIAGAVGEAEVRALVDEHYGKVPAREVHRRNRAAPPTAAHEPRLTVREPQAREALLLRAWMAPSLTTPKAEQSLPLEVLAHLLGSGQGSRLHAALVETGLAVQAGASYDSEAYGVTEFMVYGVPRRGVTPGTAGGSRERGDHHAAAGRPVRCRGGALDPPDVLRRAAGAGQLRRRAAHAGRGARHRVAGRRRGVLAGPAARRDPRAGDRGRARRPRRRAEHHRLAAAGRGLIR
jgi:zinc protease